MTTSTRGASRTPAVLVLEDGRTFRGRAYGAVGVTFGEAVFSTGMTGYQETLTDPSYHRQVVVMTAPHVGNTGVNDEDPESKRIWVMRLCRTRPRARALQLALPPLARRGARTAGRRRDLRHRHPGAHPPSARARRHARRHLLRERAARRGHDARRGASGPRDEGRQPVRGGRHGGGVRRPRHRREEVHRRRRGPRHQGHDPAPYGRARHRGACAARHRDRRGHLRGRSRRRVLLQRSRRPGEGRAPGRPDARRARAQDPALRHLFRQPDPGARARLRHVQAEVRPPGHQPAGPGPYDRQGRGHRAQPRFRRRRAARPRQRHPLRACRGLARLPERPGRRRAPAARPAGCSASSTTPRRRRARTTRPTCSTAS